MQRLEFQDCIAEIAALCANASAAILPFYGNQEALAVISKDDDSPLTQADLAADRLLHEGLPRIIHLPIISEESQASQSQRYEDYWLIDPIDGTKEFIQGTGQFCIAIARIYQQRPILGMIYAPLTHTYWYAAQNLGAYKTTAEQAAQRLQCRRFNPKQATLLSASHKPSLRLHQFLHQHFGDYQHISQPSALKYGRLAEGNADFYVKLSLGGSEWDIAAGDILLQEAGGGLRYFPNQAVQYGGRDTLRNPPFLAYGAGFSESQIAAYFDAMQTLFAAEKRQVFP